MAWTPEGEQFSDRSPLVHQRSAPELWPYYADNGDVEVYDYDRAALEQLLHRRPVYIEHPQG